MKIGLVYDLRSDYIAEGFTEEAVAEFDSPSTIEAIETAIHANGHTPELIGHGRALAGRLVAGDRWDLVFTIAEGLSGRSRESQVPALLEMFDVPYTFSNPLTCALTLDKAMAKRVVRSAGVSTPPFAVVRTPEDLATVDIPLPAFVKPIAEGTGKGVTGQSRVDARADLNAVALSVVESFRQPALIEVYLPGREFTTGVLGTGSAASVLGTMEIHILDNASERDYTYEVKEQCESCVEYRPMEPGTLRREVEALALAAYRALECRDAGRVDVRLDAEGRPAFLELNALPGLHPTHSDLPMIATQEGMAYRDLIGAILDSARPRIGAPPS